MLSRCTSSSFGVALRANLNLMWPLDVFAKNEAKQHRGWRGLFEKSLAGNHLKERHLETRSRCCQRSFKGNTYDLVPGSLSVEQGQRKQEKDNRAKTGVEVHTRSVGYFSVSAFFTVKQFRKLRCCNGMKYWIHKSIVAFPLHRLWLLRMCRRSVFENLAPWLKKCASHCRVFVFSIVASIAFEREWPFARANASKGLLCHRERILSRGSEIQSLNTNLVATVAVSKFGLAWLHLNNGMTNSIYVWWCVGWPTSVTKDGVKCVLAQEWAVLLVDPVFHSMDAANATRERQTYNCSVCNRKWTVSPISAIATL